MSLCLSTPSSVALYRYAFHCLTQALSYSVHFGLSASISVSNTSGSLSADGIALISGAPKTGYPTTATKCCEPAETLRMFLPARDSMGWGMLSERSASRDVDQPKAEERGKEESTATSTSVLLFSHFSHLSLLFSLLCTVFTLFLSSLSSTVYFSLVSSLLLVSLFSYQLFGSMRSCATDQRPLERYASAPRQRTSCTDHNAALREK